MSSGRPAIALLGSGEFEPWTEEVDRWLLERATGDGTVLILPTASAPEGDGVFDRWGTMGLEHYRDVDILAEVVPIKTNADANDDRLVASLSRASVAFFSGGNPAYLASVLLGSVFWAALLEEMNRGLAYAGCSAGIACLGESALNSAARSFDDGWLGRPGLRLFPNTTLGPHWDAIDRYVPGLRERLVLAVPSGGKLFAVDERTAAVGDGATWTVMGSGSAHCYTEGEWQDAAAGQTLTAPLLETAPVGD
jgi:cyanophycinase-like exopeptidase